MERMRRYENRIFSFGVLQIPTCDSSFDSSAFSTPHLPLYTILYPQCFCAKPYKLVVSSSSERSSHYFVCLKLVDQPVFMLQWFITLHSFIYSTWIMRAKLRCFQRFCGMPYEFKIHFVKIKVDLSSDLS